MESLFVVTKLIASPAKMIAYIFILNCFKCDCDQYSTVAFATHE